MRRSQYRALLRRVLRAANGPLTAAEVRDALDETGIGIATVYRHLNEGLDDGDIVLVELPGGTKRFELAGLPHHHHFECVGCRRVFDLVGCPSGIDDLLPPGFQLDGHEVILSGRCRDCARTRRRQ